MKTKILFPLAGLAFFCACKGPGSSSHSADTVPSNDTAQTANIARPADTTQSAPENKTAVTAKAGATGKENIPQPTPIESKLVKTASMRFEVKDVKQTSSNIAALTENSSGTVMYHTISSEVTDSTTVRKSEDSVMKVTVLNSTADMTVKIPAGKVETFVNEVAKLGATVNSLKFEVNDKTFDYLGTKMKLRNQQQRANSGENGSAGLKNADNMLEYKNQMVDQQIGNLRTDESAKNAVIKLTFYEKNSVHKEMMASPDLSDYREPASNRFATSFKKGWTVFADFMVALANFWVALPAAGLIWGVLYFVNKKRKMADAMKS